MLLLPAAWCLVPKSRGLLVTGNGQRVTIGRNRFVSLLDCLKPTDFLVDTAC